MKKRNGVTSSRLLDVVLINGRMDLVMSQISIRYCMYLQYRLHHPYSRK